MRRLNKLCGSLFVDRLKRSGLFFLERASIYARNVMFIDMDVISFAYKNEVEESDRIYNVESVRSYA